MGAAEAAREDRSRQRWENAPFRGTRWKRGEGKKIKPLRFLRPARPRKNITILGILLVSFPSQLDRTGVGQARLLKTIATVVGPLTRP